MNIDLNSKLLFVENEFAKQAAEVNDIPIIEKRKTQIKNYLCIDRGADEDILGEAKKLGFI